MTDKEKFDEVLCFIRDWDYNVEKMEKVKEALSRLQPSVTTSYNVTGTKSGGFANKLEVLIEKKDEYNRKLSKIRTKIMEFDEAKQKARLTELEEELLLYTKNNCSLRAYAKETGIYKSKVYKVRDRAVKKIAKFIDWDVWNNV